MKVRRAYESLFQRIGVGRVYCVALLVMTAICILHQKARAQSVVRVRTEAEWQTVASDLKNTRYSPLARLNITNVKQLKGAWISKKFDDGATSWVTPVEHNGLLFVTAGARVYAMDARTGQTVWSHKTLSDSIAIEGTKQARNLAAPNWKGVGLGQGLVFLGLQDGHVIALKETTGELVWVRQTGTDQPRKGQWASVAPLYIDGVVFSGLSDGDSFQRGRVTALDANSGRILWQIFTVPGPGEPGHESWPTTNDAWTLGGGGVWTNPPVDRELGTVYFTTGNAVPAHSGDLRPGDNLYTSSVLAIDIKTGRLKWFYQLVHHDVFEADVGTPVILYDAHVGGTVRKALAVLRADGFLFQLDRETGRPILPVQERPVPQLASQNTSPTQPFPVGGESILMDCEDWRKEKIPAGFVLGCMWTPPASPPPSKDPQNVLAPFPIAKGVPMAYSPTTGYFYAVGRSQLFWPRRSQDPYFLNWTFTVPGLRTYGEFAAIDGRTGKIAWRRRIPASSVVGGPMVTGGDLVFRNSGDGSVEAYNARTGDVLWQFRTGYGGPGLGGGSPSSYTIDGEQYVAATMGSAVWAFRLGGSIPSRQDLSSSAGPEEQFSGPLIDTDEIETTSLQRTAQEPGMRYFVDEYSFNPYRARVKAGTLVMFVNNGNMRHEVIAVDGSWGTGPLGPTQQAWVRFDKPGEYVYVCKEHPWTYGQIVVTEASKSENDTTADVYGSRSLSGEPTQLSRGKEEYTKNCSTCHGEDMQGRGRAPPLVGESFMLRWRHSEIGDLLNDVRTTMPQTSPGTLSPKVYLSIVAYLLNANGAELPKGQITETKEMLQQVIVEDQFKPSDPGPAK